MADGSFSPEFSTEFDTLNPAKLFTSSRSSYKYTLPSTSNREDWSEAIILTDAATGDRIDISLCRVTMTLIKYRRSANRTDGYYGLPNYGYDSTGIMLTGSTDTGEITLPDVGTFMWLFPATRMNGIPAGEYLVGIRISQDSRTMQLVIGTVIVDEGIDQQ